MKFFTSSDFDDVSLITPSYAAGRANAKLEREGKIVLTRGAVNDFWLDVTSKEFHDRDFKHGATHKALLINIEPLEKCKHPKEKVNKKWGLTHQSPLTWYECECGAKVQPKEFEEVK